jgi:hypothetical protein
MLSRGLRSAMGAITGADYRSVYGAGATFHGEAVDNSSVVVKYTYYGDTDLNGTVNFDDYVRTDVGFNTHRTGWFNGDFNYSGEVNFDDYVLIDIAFNTQGRPAAPEAKPSAPRVQQALLT